MAATRLNAFLGAALGVATMPATTAQDALTPTTQDRAVAINLRAGYEYDSNVAVLELDTSADAGDRAALLDFGVAYDKSGAGRSTGPMVRTATNFGPGLSSYRPWRILPRYRNRSLI